MRRSSETPSPQYFASEQGNTVSFVLFQTPPHQREQHEYPRHFRRNRSSKNPRYRTHARQRKSRQTIGRTHRRSPYRTEIRIPVGHIAADIANSLQEAVIGITGDAHIHLSIDTEITTHKVQPGVATIKGVKNIIAVASGKGGVGKSTTTANLATAMARMGARVGVLDADLYGPSQPTMLGVQDRKPDQQNKKLVPVEADSGIQVMSIGFWSIPIKPLFGAARWSAKPCSS